MDRLFTAFDLQDASSTKQTNLARIEPEVVAAFAALGSPNENGPIERTNDARVLLIKGDWNASARNITLTGVLTGSGSLTLDSNATTSSGNAESGTLTISNHANTWDGDLILNRGTVVTTAANGLGGGDITFNQFGRIIVRATAI